MTTTMVMKMMMMMMMACDDDLVWPAIAFQQQVRDTTAANQAWRMCLLACQTGCMELTAT